MNKIMLIGNLGKDPEMNYTPNGYAVTRFTLAVNRTTKAANGVWQKETEWFSIVAWNQLAETCAKYLAKGHKVFVEGRLATRKYTDRNNVEHTAVEVVIHEMEMLTPKDRQRSPDEDDENTWDERPF